LIVDKDEHREHDDYNDYRQSLCGRDEPMSILSLNTSRSGRRRLIPIMTANAVATANASNPISALAIGSISAIIAVY
jgi:hypothetical protein